MPDISIRPDLEEYEFYDPQSMQEYSYHVEKYIDYLGQKYQWSHERRCIEIGLRHEEVINDKRNRLIEGAEELLAHNLDRSDFLRIINEVFES